MLVGDPAGGLAVVGAADRRSAKLVDLDPHWQISSQVWGLIVRLVDPVGGEELLSGSFRVAAFRDLWTRQIAKAEVNGQGSGGSFTSVLDDVVYGPGAAASPVLSALREATQASRLSIVLNVFGYFYSHVAGRFGTGSLTGCIGPWRPGEPETFVAGRRIDRGVVHALPPPAPLALLARRPDDARRVICREAAGGLYVRADDFVHRIDAGATTTATLYAVRRGEPASEVTVHLARHVRPTSPRRPAFDYSTLTSVQTGPAGTAEVTLTAGDPGGQRAQQKIDGVVETIGYAPQRTATGSLDYEGTGLIESQDVIVAHVRDAYHAPDRPDRPRGRRHGARREVG